MTVQDETTVSDGILLSDAAAAKVKALLEQEGRDDLALRVAVQPGGCSGLRYQLFFDERSLDGDVVKDFDGVKVVTDRMSAPYLGGASIDFVDTIEKQGFTIDNPNATRLLRLRRLLQLVRTPSARRQRRFDRGRALALPGAARRHAGCHRYDGTRLAGRRVDAPSGRPAACPASPSGHTPAAISTQTCPGWSRRVVIFTSDRPACRSPRASTV